MLYKYLLLLALSVTTWINAYISRIETWKNPLNNKVVILVHDIHEHKKENIQEDTPVVISFLQKLTQTNHNVRMFIERMNDSDANTPVRKTIVHLQEQDLLLGSVYEAVKKIPDINLIPFDCRVVSALLPILSNLPWSQDNHRIPLCIATDISTANALLTLEDVAAFSAAIYEKAGVTMESFFEEIDRLIRTISTFEDGTIHSNFYAECVKSIEDNESLNQLRKKYSSLKEENKSPLSIPALKAKLMETTFDFMELTNNFALASLLTQNLALKLLDAYLIHELAKPDQANVTILYYGAAHMESISATLAKLNYQAIYSDGNQWQQKPYRLSSQSFQECLAKINN